LAGMTTPRQLLLHELQDIYYVENQLVRVLPRLAEEATDTELTRGLEQHLRQTERHVKNLDQAFKALGEQPRGEQCPGFDGLKEEHDEFISEEEPAPVVKVIFLSGAAARTEHYEIAAYTGMLSLARSLKEREVVALLDKNLKDEKEALRTVDTIGRRIGRESTKTNGRTTARTRSNGGRKPGNRRTRSSGAGQRSR
jgi:ferritin-like metal-binding protein YciE